MDTACSEEDIGMQRVDRSCGSALLVLYQIRLRSQLSGYRLVRTRLGHSCLTGKILISASGFPQQVLPKPAASGRTRSPNAFENPWTSVRYFGIAEAVNQVVVDHACRLHVGIAYGWSDELEPSLHEVSTHLPGNGRGNRYL